MWTLILSALLGLAAGLALGLTHASGPIWSGFWALLIFAAAQAGAGLLLRRRVQALMTQLQAGMVAGQKRLQQKVNQWQTRPPGSIKQAQSELERDQRAFIDQALQQTAAFEPYYRWSPLLRRQIDTLRMQLQYQAKRFDEVDRLLPKCLYLEPLTVAMRLARMHVNKDAGLDAFYTRHSRRLRYGQGAIVHATYAWVQVQRGNVEGAHHTLVEASKRMENETITRNRDHLANNRVNQFSNAGLGDEWYALGLEEPKVKVQRHRFPGRPF